MKKIQFFVLAFLLCIAFSLGACAASPRLVDDADILRTVEEDMLTAMLDSVSEEYSFDVVVVIVESTNGSDIEDYTENFYDSNGYGYDGILLLLCMESREYWISTTGRGMSVFYDSALMDIEDEILSDLGEGSYYNAFCRFADICEGYLETAGTSSDGDTYDLYDGYDVYEPYEYEKEPFEVFTSLLISLGIGFLISFIVVSVWKGQLKTVKFQPNAAAYIKQGSLKLTQSNDAFLYHTVNRVPKVQNKPSGGGMGSMRSSSGRSHGGRGGKF